MQRVDAKLSQDNNGCFRSKISVVFSVENVQETKGHFVNIRKFKAMSWFEKFWQLRFIAWPFFVKIKLSQNNNFLDSVTRWLCPPRITCETLPSWDYAQTLPSWDYAQTLPYWDHVWDFALLRLRADFALLTLRADFALLGWRADFALLGLRADFALLGLHVRHCPLGVARRLNGTLRNVCQNMHAFKVLLYQNLGIKQG